MGWSFGNSMQVSTTEAKQEPRGTVPLTLYIFNTKTCTESFYHTWQEEPVTWKFVQTKGRGFLIYSSIATIAIYEKPK